MSVEKSTKKIEFTEKAGTELSICVLAEHRRTAEIMLAAEAWAINNSLSKQCRLDIQLCIDELFSNICRYSKIPPCSKSKELLASIVLKKENNDVVLILSDTGEEFNPMNVQPPDLSISIEERSAGGLGLYLVKSTAKKAEYFYQDGKNVIKLLLDEAS